MKKFEKMYQMSLPAYPNGDLRLLTEIREKLVDDENLGQLWLQLKMGLCELKEYQKRGISEDIFLQTMKFYSHTVTEEHDIFQRWTFQTLDWGYRQLFLKIFRLSSFEFERVEKEDKKFIRVEKEDKKFIFIHIPGGADLTEIGKAHSYQKAREFMKAYFPDYAEVPYRCDSWLLSPTLRQFLNPTSKIRAFQDDFLLLEAGSQAMGYLKWLYHTVDPDLTKLSEDTSLQKAVKNFVLRGGKIGDGLGELVK